jgi:C4-dicarboxylate-specific signal transduction histidine kinase
MDDIVSHYEQQARRQATGLRVLGLASAITIIGLMIALERLLLRPATRVIRQQWESLEERVAERTAELTQLNATLQHEIHVRRQTEEHARTLSNQLAHTSRVMSMGQLAVGLAHEINQPLAAIANYAATCSLQLDGAAADVGVLKHLIARIGDAAHRAGEIVRGMRTFLRPGQSPMSDVKINTLVGEVVSLFQPEAVRRNVRLQLVLDDSDPWVHVAPSRIQQVLMNLLQNAVDAMQNVPQDDRWLIIRSYRAAGWLHVEVIDTGPGFGDADPETLFEPFFTTKETGLGMGLAISRTIIQEHSGRLWAKRRHHGSAICFTLPLDATHDQRVTPVSHCVCR